MHLAELSRTIDAADLGRRIRAARVAAGMTQAQVAGDDISAAHLSRIEIGQRRPEAGLLERMAHRMGVTLEELLLDVSRSGIQELRLTVDHAELALVAGDSGAALAAADAALSDADVAVVPQVRRAALRVRAGALEIAGDLDGAIVILEDLLADPSPDAGWLKELIALCRCYRDSGDFARAISVGERAAQTIEELNLSGLTEAIQLTVTIASAHLLRGDAGEAMRTCMRALEAAERHDSLMGKAAAYWNASTVEATRGNTDTAIELARKALALFEVSEDFRNLARLRSQIANLQLMQDPPDAETALTSLEHLERDLSASGGSAWDVAFLHLLRARAQFFLGDHAAARTSIEHVNAVRPDPSPTLEAQALVLEGRIAFAAGDLKAARARFQAGVHALTGAGADHDAGQLWFELADLLAEVGDHEAAVDAFRSAGASAGLRPPTRSHALRPA